MHPEFAKSLFGWIGAGASTLCTFLAQFLPKEVEPWGQVGAVGLLIYFLVYAVKHQNAEAREERAKREAGEVERKAEAKRWEDKWTAEHQANLAAREQDRETRDRLAEAVKELASAVKKV